MIIDSHCHLDMLDLANFDNNFDNIFKNAFANGVEHFLCVSVNLEDFETVHAIAKKYDYVDASVGLHPNETEGREASLEELLQLGSLPDVVAIGETGLDYYRSAEDNQWQHERFRIHINAAKQLQKPLIIHTRQAQQDTIEILKQEDAASIGGVMHCFAEDWAFAQRSLDIGFYISFSGIVTFKNAKAIKEVAQKVPLDRMLVETDCPYLAPVPHRGKANEPAYVMHVVDYLAELRGLPAAEIASITTENYYNLFKRDR